MKIKSLYLKNFRLFDELELEMPEVNTVVLIGKNGSGKSTVLDAIGVLLAEVVGQLSSNFKVKKELDLGDDDVKIGTKATAIGLNFLSDNEGWNGVNVRLQKELVNGGNLEANEPNVEYLNKISTFLSIKQPVKLPLFVYYRTNRTEQLKDKNGQNIPISDRLFGYQNAFNTSISAFVKFQEWFLKQENIENAQKLEKKDFEFELDSLSVVRNAIKQFLSKLYTQEIFSRLKGVRNSEDDILYNRDADSGEVAIEKDGTQVKLQQLSSGEKMLILLVADIARRLVILNDKNPNSLAEEGIVLIDELEMHLHPQWQRNVLPALNSVFPNIQFIVSTHSPQVLSRVEEDSIVILEDGQIFAPQTNPFGRDSNGILEEVFETTERPKEVDDKIKEVFKLLAIRPTDLDAVRIEMENLKAMVAKDDPILVRINSTIERIEMLKS